MNQVEIPAIDACGARKLVEEHYAFRSSLKGILENIQICSQKGKEFIMVPKPSVDVVNELKARKFVVSKAMSNDEVVVSWTRE